VVPAIQKPYIVKNGSDAQVTIKVSGQTGVIVPVGKTALVYNNGTDVVTSVDHIPSLTLASALPVASGGTGITAFGTGVATALGQNVSGSGSIALTTSPVFTTPNLGTPSAATLTSATGLPVSTGIAGLGTNVATALAVNVGSAGAVVVNGGALGTPSSGTLTNATGLPVSTGIDGLGTGVATFLATPSSSNLAAAVTDETGSGALVFATSPTLVTPALGTPSAAVLTNATGLPIDGGTTGTLPIARGGTDATTNTQARTNLGLGSIATQASSSVTITGGSITGITDLAVADGGTGASDASTARTNLSVPSNTGTGASGTWDISITGNAATATSATTASNGGVTSVNSQTGAITNTSLDSIGSYVIAWYVPGAHPQTNGTSLSINSTVAGSTLRYGPTVSTLTVYGDLSSGGNLIANDTSSTYAGGGTALTGTWRCLGRPGYFYDGGTPRWGWYPGLFVRVS
jgi:hypothetical protein